jgi:hypothetical protein
MTAAVEMPFPFSDLALARRLERAEGESSAHIIEARARLFPGSGATWIEVAGANVLFDGPSSPLTQTFGLGLFRTVTPADLERTEEFFRQRGAPVFHEISPLAEPALLPLLNERGYQPLEFTSVMFRPIWRGMHLALPQNDRIHVRLARAGEEELWAETAARGWAGIPELGDAVLDLARVSAHSRSALPFLAELDGRPIATGALNIRDGVGLLAGASTVPEERRQGAQLGLLDSRLRYAAEQGCDLAMMGAAPGSGSQRNAERHGFRIAYTRIKWHRKG